MKTQTFLKSAGLLFALFCIQLPDSHANNPSDSARMGQDCQVLKTYQKKLQNGTERLIFEGIYTSKSRQHFTVSIPLKPDEQGRFYYISGQSIVCSASGCNNCTIDQGNCIGCCSSTSNAVSLTSPLLKVQTNIEE